MTLITYLSDLDDHMPWPSQIRHLALVGNPKSGKSTVAEMLADEFWGLIIDDGAPLREAYPTLTGTLTDLPYSQDGKATRVQVGDRSETVREGLGELGNYLEARYGEEIMALLAMKHAEATYPSRIVAPFFIYPSVRKLQPRAYRRAGGVVIQIDNPLAGPSGNAFDTWDTTSVDLVIDNNPDEMGLDELRAYVRRIPELVEALA